MPRRPRSTGATVEAATAKVYGPALRGRLTDPLFYSLAESINRQCDREIALRVPITDREHAEGKGCSVWPLDCLTDVERNRLMKTASDLLRERMDAAWPASARAISTSILAAFDGFPDRKSRLNRDAADYTERTREAAKPAGKALATAMRDLEKARGKLAADRAALPQQGFRNPVNRWRRDSGITFATFQPAKSCRSCSVPPPTAKRNARFWKPLPC